MDRFEEEQDQQAGLIVAGMDTPPRLSPLVCSAQAQEWSEPEYGSRAARAAAGLGLLMSPTPLTSLGWMSPHYETDGKLLGDLADSLDDANKWAPVYGSEDAGDPDGGRANAEEAYQGEGLVDMSFLDDVQCTAPSAAVEHKREPMPWSTRAENAMSPPVQSPRFLRVPCLGVPSPEETNQFFRPIDRHAGFGKVKGYSSRRASPALALKQKGRSLSEKRAAAAVAKTPNGCIAKAAIMKRKCARRSDQADGRGTDMSRSTAPVLGRDLLRRLDRVTNPATAVGDRKNEGKTKSGTSVLSLSAALQAIRTASSRRTGKATREATVREVDGGMGKHLTCPFKSFPPSQTTVDQFQYTSFKAELGEGCEQDTEDDALEALDESLNVRTGMFYNHAQHAHWSSSVDAALAEPADAFLSRVSQARDATVKRTRMQRTEIQGRQVCHDTYAGHDVETDLSTPPSLCMRKRVGAPSPDDSEDFLAMMQSAAGPSAKRMLL
ncbi:hypothetical protein FVE85_1450 [Porphyridium purpureum]|uniref:Uncharacterized protein n=1 Tax=Porphyridium purpureum TaxID=35688 RepID=A0A5J4YVJ4_PORPP|nr:hypothetical protein FVE85_1450 [Porphyridium purpureum]|eukprot:POR3899..scf209_3